MGNGVTVIFGLVRSQQAASSMSHLSGPPGGGWLQPCGAPKPRRRGRARPPEPPPARKPVKVEKFSGRDFSRRALTFVG
ncbi:MAG TPA: hypothetical protein VK034_21510 [Enhygromyxa sp.]|nr:hypothetical protein [Enhygromyxa sp.]